MPLTYEVRRVAPRQIEAELLRIWRENLPVGCDVEDKLRWTYEAGPTRPESLFLLLARQAEGAAAPDPGAAVGVAGFGLRRMQLGRGGPEGAVALMSDLAVDRAHRSALPALRLVRALKQELPAEAPLAYGFPNELALGIFQRAGFRELGRMTRYVCVLRHASYLARLTRLPLIPTVGGAALDLARMTARAPAWLRAVRDFRLRWIDRLDHRFDDLWDRARGQHGVVARRDAAFLHWRYLQVPVHRCRIVALQARGSAEDLQAYAAVEREGEVAHLRDLFGLEARLGTLLDLLLPALFAAGARSVSFRYLGSPALIAALGRRGFRPRESDRSVVWEPGPSLPSPAQAIADARDWHLTDGDEDI